jgi:hypothetical protein
MSAECQDNRWFNFFMAMTIVGLGCIGAMIMVLNNQLWSKMDRMVTLFQERSRDVGINIENQNQRLGCLEGHVIAIKSRLDMLEKESKKR